MTAHHLNNNSVDWERLGPRENNDPVFQHSFTQLMDCSILSVIIGKRVNKANLYLLEELRKYH